MLIEALSETPEKLFLQPSVPDSVPEEIVVVKHLDNTPQPHVFELREGLPFVIFLGKESELMQEFHRLTDKARERNNAAQKAEPADPIIFSPQ